MKDSNIVLFGEWVKDPRVYNSEEELNLKSLKQIFRSYSKLESLRDNEMFIFIEDLDEEVVEDNFEELLKKAKKHRFHCHRCKKINVIISYNGKEYTHEFNPASTAHKIMLWTAHQAGISPNDTVGLIFRIESETGKTFENNDHLGSFVNFPKCNIHLYLTPKDRYQG